MVQNIKVTFQEGGGKVIALFGETYQLLQVDIAVLFQRLLLLFFQEVETLQKHIFQKNRHQEGRLKFLELCALMQRMAAPLEAHCES